MQLTAAETDEVKAGARDLKRSRPALAAVLRRLLATRDDLADGLTTRQAADLIGVSAQTVRNWADRGWLLSTRSHPLSRRKIDRSAIDRIRTARTSMDRVAARSTLSDAQIDAEIRTYRRARSRGEGNAADTSDLRPAPATSVARGR